MRIRETDTEHIAPCPFCHSQNVVFVQNPNFKTARGYLECQECHVVSTEHSRKEVIKIWNEAGHSNIAYNEYDRSKYYDPENCATYKWENIN